MSDIKISSFFLILFVLCLLVELVQIAISFDLFYFFSMENQSNIKLKTETPVTVASSSTQSTLPKPIVTTAPSSVQQSPQIISQPLPPLKQKTGIIKSKVPPPVPPRGSPRVDRRTSASSYKSAGASPRATPSSGEPNYLNDKYFDTVQPNPNNLCRLTPQKLYKKEERRSSTPRTPIFRERSPTCVRDWLEVNDFAASDYDESVLKFKITEPTKCITIKARKPIPIQTALLQRQSSFRAFSYSSDSSVQCKVEKFVEINGNLVNKTLISSNIEETGISTNIVSDRIKSYDTNNNHTTACDTILHPESMDIEKTIGKGNISKLRKTFENVPPNRTPPVVKPRMKKAKRNSTLHINPIVFNDKSNIIFDTLKRNKSSSIDTVTDQNDNVTIKKSEILKSHSSIISVENNKYLDAFSLDGEFV